MTEQISGSQYSGSFAEMSVLPIINAQPEAWFGVVSHQVSVDACVAIRIPAIVLHLQGIEGGKFEGWRAAEQITPSPSTKSMLYSKRPEAVDSNDSIHEGLSIMYNEGNTDVHLRHVTIEGSLDRGHGHVSIEQRDLHAWFSDSVERARRIDITRTIEGVPVVKVDSIPPFEPGEWEERIGQIKPATDDVEPVVPPTTAPRWLQRLFPK